MFELSRQKISISTFDGFSGELEGDTIAVPPRFMGLFKL
jgi:hypothetical protein